MSTDLYAVVTARIVAALEAGTPPWSCPWRRSGVDPRPANITTSRLYRGINVLLLNLRCQAEGFNHNRWLTFSQAQGLGARVRRGETGTQIVFFKLHELDAERDLREERDDAQRRVVPLLRAFTVFNVDQIEGLPEGMAPAPVPRADWEPIEVAERLLDTSGAVIRHGGSKAFYAPGPDVIQMPPTSAFDASGDYYATALHELTHWTGHPSRCNRPLGMRHGIDAYAFEELVAEMGAAFLTDYCGLVGRMQHASYVASWLQALRNDKRLIFGAASLAQKAADFLLPVPTELLPAAQASESASTEAEAA